MHIIVRGRTKYGNTRAEQEKNLRKDGLFGMKDENFDKLKYIEKKHSIKGGFLRQTDLGGI